MSKIPFSRILIFVLNGVALGLACVVPSSVMPVFLAFIFAAVLACSYSHRTKPRWYEPTLMGFAIGATLCPWLPTTIERFSGFSPMAAYSATALIAMWGAGQFLLFHLVFIGLDRKVLRGGILALPLAWVAAETLWPKLVPWTLGESQIAFHTFAQVADLAGTSLLSFFIILSGVLFVGALTETKRRVRFLVQFGVGVLLVASYSIVRTWQLEKTLRSAPAMSAVLVQGALDPSHDFVFEKVPTNVAHQRRLSYSTPLGSNVDLVVWPESSVGWNYHESETSLLPSSEHDPLAGAHNNLLFGGQTPFADRVLGLDTYYNTAFLRTASGELKRYRKQVLVPFSEFIPLHSVFSWFPSAVGKRFVYRPGRNEQPLAFRARSGVEVKAAMAICYEDMWPEVFQAAVRDHGANLLVAIANDIWFDPSVAALQHQMSARWRAIENRRYLLRATNTGVTAIVDPFGVTVKSLPRYHAGALAADDVRVLDVSSVYSQLGSIPFLIVSIFTVIASLAGYRVR